MLLRLRRDYAFDLTEIDILSDTVLEAKYRYDVPVLVIDDDFQLTAPLHENEVCAFLNR